ncbi:MAG: serine hydrolase domain-containing protein, partial [Planctomycetota bacterium]
MLQSVRLVLCLALLAPNAPSQGGGERTSLAGVWQAVRTFEVGAHGELVLRREGEDWRAEIGPFRSVPVDLSGGALSVRLPGDRGSFEGQPTERGTIEGHWTQRATRHAGMRAATPVTLLPGEGGTWRGNVEPLDDVFTCFLVVGPGETVDGVEAYPAFLRNPERNFGVFAEGERLERDGDEVRFIGRWRGRGEPYVLSMGTVSEAGDALRLPFRGSTFDFERVEGDPASPFRARTPEPWTYVPPPARDDGWAVGTLAEVGMDEGPIRELVEDVIDAPVDSVHAPYVHAMLIARHGKLVVEESFHGFHRGVPHDTRSAAKSLTSFLVGATIQAGEAVALDDPVYETVGAPYLHGGLEARKRAITLEHLLTMSSGLDCDDRDPDSAGNEDTIQSQAENPDWYELILGLDLVRPPGTKAVYGSAQPHLVGRVLSAATGDSVEDLLHRHVARPLDFG